MTQTTADQTTNEDDDSFSYVLEFAAAKCPGCGTAGEPGVCPECGQSIGKTDEVSPATKARIAAIGPLSSRINDLIVAFDRIPQANIPVTADQMFRAVEDAEVFSQISAMPELGRDLGTLDLNDPGVIGQRLRHLVEGYVDQVERLFQTCRLLARFEAPGPAADLKEIAIEAGAWGALLAQRTVDTLIAPDVGTARAAEDRLQELLDDFPYAQRHSEALDELSGWVEPDPDARAAPMIGQPGRYSDDFGLPDLRRVFAAFGDQEKPFEAMAARARKYFSHLLDPSAPSDVAFEAMLILPALGLATLDRPLLGHRIAEQGHELLMRAWAQDSAATQALIERTSNQGQLVFAAAGRIETGFRMLGVAEIHQLADEQAVLKTAMEAYLDLAEGAYRTYGWFLRDLADVVSGSSFPAATDAPMLANLGEQLAAKDEEICQLFAAASDSRLRNARGHCQYHWDAASERIQDLRSGDEWTVDEFEAAQLGMVAAILGMDAAYSAFLAGGQAGLNVPDWLATGKSVEANRLMAQLAFGGFGFEVLDVRDQGSTIVIERPEPLDKVRLMSPVAGVAAVIRDLDGLRVVDDANDVLLDVDPSTIVDALAAPETVKDIACLGRLLSDAERSGVEPAEALEQVLWVQVAAVVIGGMQDLVNAGGADPEIIRRIDQRLSFVLEFARGREGSKSKRNRRLLERVSKARSAAFAASHDDDAFGRLAQQLTRLLESVQSRGIRWPWS